jgi:hypothetical protein
MQLISKELTNRDPLGYYLRAPLASWHIQPDGKDMSDSAVPNFRQFGWNAHGTKLVETRGNL